MMSPALGNAFSPDDYPKIVMSDPPAVTFTPPTRDDLLAMRAHRADTPPSRTSSSLFFKYVDDERLPAIADWLSQVAKHPIPHPLCAQRIFNGSATQWGCALLHNGSSTDAEFIVHLERGMMTRTLLRALASWIFGDLRFTRITVRVRASDEVNQHYARRAGFRFEGKQSGWYADGVDCCLWSMRATDCFPRDHFNSSNTEAGTAYD